MKFKVDFCSLLCIEVEANDEDEACKIAESMVHQPTYMGYLATNAEVTGVEEVEGKDE